jgi:hypothetical protein
LIGDGALGPFGDLRRMHSIVPDTPVVNAPATGEYCAEPLHFMRLGA